MNKKLKIKVINDPSHGWGSVSLKLLEQLDLIDKISQYSYMTNTRAYLEYHSDLNKLFEKLKEKNIEYEVTSSHLEKTNIRSFPPFNKEKLNLIENIKVGSSFYIYNSDTKSYDLPVKITNINKNKIYTISDTGVSFYPMSFNKCLNSVKSIPEEKIDTIQLKNNEGIPFLIHFENKHNTSIITVYDKRFQFTPKGQKVAQYNADTIKAIKHGAGLNLGNSGDWVLSSTNMLVLKSWVIIKEKQISEYTKYFEEQEKISAEKNNNRKPKF